MPAVAKADDCIHESLLWNAVEEADEIIVDGSKVDVFRCVCV